VPISKSGTVCGTQAAQNAAQQAAAGLRAIGFDNIKVLKGGLKALANSDSTKNAPMVQQ